MNLNEFLLKNKAIILERWLGRIMETYPPDAARFFKDEHDRFLNPVGARVRQGIETLYDELLGDMDEKKISEALDAVVRVRSVQDFSASEAVAYVFFLEEAVSDVLGEGGPGDPSLWKGLVEFMRKVDTVVLRAFDIYVGCKEKLMEISINQIKAERDRAYRLLDSADRLIEKMAGSQKLPTGALASET